MVEAGNTYKFIKYVNDQYHFVSEEIPEPAEGEVLIKVAYSTFNPIDRF